MSYYTRGGDYGYGHHMDGTSRTPEHVQSLANQGSNCHTLHGDLYWECQNNRDRNPAYQQIEVQPRYGDSYDFRVDSVDSSIEHDDGSGTFIIGLLIFYAVWYMFYLIASSGSSNITTRQSYDKHTYGYTDEVNYQDIKGKHLNEIMETGYALDSIHLTKSGRPDFRYKVVKDRYGSLARYNCIYG